MKRSRDKIISEILDACINGANKTRIVYQANLNFRTINPYLELLTRNGLINVEKDQTVVYTTTLKGLNLLDEFKQIQEELSIPADDAQTQCEAVLSCSYWSASPRP